ncbi:hypothetical protein B0J18DRAFT_453599 [Chaetomium sp. MPI-SDFR-AT-0129]|nr:hypothetical protein B0J18DRAFT_453599 [Chaetomium sp. MPI-SDFR-AT-0129]
MADDEISPAEPRAENSNRDAETTQADDGVTREQARDSKALPPLPARPLPPSHQEKTLLRQSALPPPRGVHFGPLPVEQPQIPVQNEPPNRPGWRKTKWGFLLLSLPVSATIVGVGLALGYLNAPYAPWHEDSPTDWGFGSSAAAAGVSIIIVVAEFAVALWSKSRQGMHPGALVAAHLIITLMALSAVVIVSLFIIDYVPSDWYDYPRAERISLSSQTAIYGQVLLGFDCALLVIHFFLFIGACVDTNRLSNAKKQVLVVNVPVPVGPQYPVGPYGYYGVPQPFPPGAQPGHYPYPPVQAPPQARDGASPAVSQQTAMYGGYYEPAPAPTSAPVPATRAARSSRTPGQRESSAPAAASTSGSHRPQGQTTSPVEQPVQSTVPPAEA